MTSSLIQSVSNSSRAICAVVTASLAVRHPAVLGSRRTSRARRRSRKRSPVRPRACSRAERNRDDACAGRANGLGHDLRRWIKRRANEQARCHRLAVEDEGLGFRLWVQARSWVELSLLGAPRRPRCGPRARAESRRGRASGTKSPLTAVATFWARAPCSRSRPSSVALRGPHGLSVDGDADLDIGLGTHV